MSMSHPPSKHVNIAGSLSDKITSQSKHSNFIMSVSRVFLRSRLLLRASTSCVRVTPSAIPSITSSFPRRTFTSSTPAWEEIVQTPSAGPEISLTENHAEATGNPANSIALFRISRRMSKRDMEELIKGKGFNMYVVESHPVLGLKLDDVLVLTG